MLLLCRLCERGKDRGGLIQCSNKNGNLLTEAFSELGKQVVRISKIKGRISCPIRNSHFTERQGNTPYRWAGMVKKASRAPVPLGYDSIVQVHLFVNFYELYTV
jgi:hypothetical protein